MEDYVVLRTGYNKAIEDILPLVGNEISKDDILRKQAKFNSISKNYKGYFIKCYDSINNIGYKIFKDDFGIIAYMIVIDDNFTTRIEKKEAEYILSQYKQHIIKEYDNVEELEKDAAE